MITPNETKKHEIAARALRERVEQVLRLRREQRHGEPAPPPRYDGVFQDGVAWLDALAGESIPEHDVEVSVDGAVWRSWARGEGELP